MAVPVTAFAVLAILVFSPVCCRAWAGDMPVDRIRVDSSLVLIPVDVTTAIGTTVTDMRKEDFRVYEDNVEQRVTTFALEDAPVSVGVLFDASGSMRGRMHEAAAAVRAFLGTANAADEFFLIEFSDKAKLTVPLTQDPDEIFGEVRRTKAFGRTSLLDAIHLALVELKASRNPRKAIVILSDGGDNRSRFSQVQVRNDVLESDAQLYAIGIFSPDNPRKLTPEERGGPKLLDALADSSGGRLYTVKDLDELAGIGARIGNELRTEYVIGYNSTNPQRDGKYRHVTVKLTASSRPAELRTSYRHGYYAPSN